MATLILVNTVTIATASGAKVCKAGTTYDSVLQASDVTFIKSSGGILFAAANAAVAAQAVIAQKAVQQGQNEEFMSRLMLAAAAVSLDPLSIAQGALSSADQAETVVFSLAGAGNIQGVYYLPFASQQPASGANSQTMVFKLYNAAGTLVGTVATGVLNNANPMVSQVRFSLGALTNTTFGDGYSLTVTVTHAGTAVLPAGQWVVVTQPNG